MSEWLRNAFITAWVKDISQQDLLQKLQILPSKYICIGAIEKTEKEKEHFHVVVSFENSIRFSTIKNLCNTIHIEPCRTSKCVEYANKEGSYYNNFEFEKNPVNDIYISLINDMYVLTWSALVKKYPRLIMSHYDNIKKMFIDINDNDEF